MITTNPKSKSVNIALDGDMDIRVVEELKPKISDLIDKGFTHFAFDFGKCRFMCSSGLGMLVGVYKAVTAGDGDVVVENPGPEIKKLLTETKLLTMLTRKKPDAEEDIEAFDAIQKHMSMELLCLSYLNNITSSILGAEIDGEMHRHTLEGVLRSLQATHGLLLLTEEADDGTVFRVVAGKGFDNDVQAAVDEMRVEPGTLESECLETRKAHTFERDGDDALPSRLLEATGASQGILAPIAGLRKALGLVLVEAGESASAFFPHSTPILQVFANVCGLALEKQTLLDAIKYKNTQLAATLSELSKTQATLIEAGKLAVAGSLIRGLSHALNNKLVPIMGYSQMLRMMLSDRPDLSEKAGIIDATAQEIKQLVDNVRDIIQHDEPKIHLEDMREVVDMSLSILDHLFRDEQIAVERDYKHLDGRIEVDRPRMIQAFLALFQRLPEALAGTKERKLRIELERDDTYLDVILIDNGRVIPPEDLKTICNPLSDNDGAFDTDRFNCGVANSIVKDHKGEMFVSSDEEAGTRMTLHIPLQQALPNIDMIGL